MSPRPQRNRVISWLYPMVGLLLLLSGVYLAYTIFSPAIELAMIDETDNPTVTAVKKTKPKSAKLLIPKINLQVPYGKSENALLKGAWWRLPENGNPKDGGNFVLSAHRFIMDYTPAKVQEKSPFYNIDKLAIGDKLYVDYDNQRYEYIVNELKSVEPTAVHIENRTNEPRLTLYSCTLGGSLDGRDVIIAKPINE